MGIEYYMFAIFIFVLAVIVAFLVIKGLQKNKAKQTVEMEEKEKKIMIMYSEVEEFLEGVEEYISKSKEEIEGLRYSASVDLAEMKKIAANMINISRDQYIASERNKPSERKPEHTEAILKTNEIEEKTMEIVNKDSSSKRKMRLIAMDMQRKGDSIEKIAEELKISKGEVNLMLSLKFQNLEVSEETE